MPSAASPASHASNHSLVAVHLALRRPRERPRDPPPPPRARRAGRAAAAAVRLSSSASGSPRVRRSPASISASVTVRRAVSGGRCLPVMPMTTRRSASVGSARPIRPSSAPAGAFEPPPGGGEQACPAGLLDHRAVTPRCRRSRRVVAGFGIEDRVELGVDVGVELVEQPGAAFPGADGSPASRARGQRAVEVGVGARAVPDEQQRADGVLDGRVGQVVVRRAGHGRRGWPTGRSRS